MDLEDLGLDSDETAALLRLASHGSSNGSLDPAAVVPLLMAAAASAERRADTIRGLATDLRELVRSEHASTLPSEIVTYLPSGDETVGEIYELFRTAQRQISALSTVPWTPEPGPTGQTIKEIELASLERGVEIRTIYDRAAVGEPGHLADLREYVECGEQARVLPHVRSLFFLFDDLAAIPITASGHFGDGAVLVRRGPLLGALQEWFEALWLRAIPLGALALTPSAEDFTDEERAMVGLLASGLTDKAIGRQLGVSDRTAQRRVAAVIERLGAQTRFQAGIQAARRGLL